MIWNYRAHSLESDRYKIVRTVTGLTLWHEPADGPFTRIGDLYPTIVAAKEAAEQHAKEHHEHQNTER